jgi:hypothetical protein
MPIDMIWALMKKDVYSQKYETLDELEGLVRRSWNRISNESIKNTIKHVEKRVSEIRRNNGKWV